MQTDVSANSTVNVCKAPPAGAGCAESVPEVTVKCSVYSGADMATAGQTIELVTRGQDSSTAGLGLGKIGPLSPTVGKVKLPGVKAVCTGTAEDRLTKQHIDSPAYALVVGKFGSGIKLSQQLTISSPEQLPSSAGDVTVTLTACKCDTDSDLSREHYVNSEQKSGVTVAPAGVGLPPNCRGSKKECPPSRTPND